MITVLISVIKLVWIYMTILFLIALIKRDNSIVDVGWGLGFVLITVTLMLEKPFTGMRGIAFFLVIIWGIRLTGHIFMRNWGRGEDFRYAKWREEWKSGFIFRSYFQIYMLQGLFMILIAYPVILISTAPFKPIGFTEIIGFLIWVVGFYFEALSDYQLLKFRKDPDNRGKIIGSGLWRFSRHPNYFGELLMWWGIFLFAMPVHYGWTSIISPVIMSVLLLKVSGVPMLEKKYEGNVQFELYKQRTSKFFPWFPKKPKQKPKIAG